MRESVAVIIGTFGDKEVWEPLVHRAMASAGNQTRPADRIVWCHALTLQQARNGGAAGLDVDWLIFLDADDELDTSYVEHMLEERRGDVKVPLTLGVYEDGSTDGAPVRIPWRDLRVANFVVIGAMHRRVLFEQVGGFPDYPILEDWAYWRKLHALEAKFYDSMAIYRVHVRPGSRNDQANHGEVYSRILREIPL